MPESFEPKRDSRSLGYTADQLNAEPLEHTPTSVTEAPMNTT